MPTTVASIAASLSLNNQQWLQSIQQSNTALATLNASVTTTANAVTSFSSKAVSAFGAVSASMGGALAGGVVMSKNFIGQLQQMEVQFGTLMGSSQKASQQVQLLFNMSKTSPFTLTDITQASVQLQTYGGSVLDTAKNLGMVSDAAAALNQNIGQVGSLFGQLYKGIEGGQPIGAAVYQLQQMGIISPIVAQRLEALSGVGGQQAKMWAMVTQQFQQYSGATAKMAQTLPGMTTTFMDTIRQALGGLPGSSQGLLSPLVSGVQSLMGDFNKLGQTTQWANLVKSGAKDMQSLVNAMMQVGHEADSFLHSKDVQAFVDALSHVKSALMSLAPLLAALSAAGIGQLLSAIPVLGSVFATVSPLVAGVATGFGVLVMMVPNLRKGIEDIAKSFLDVAAHLAPLMQVLVVILPVFNLLGIALQKIAPVIKALAPEIAAVVGAFLMMVAIQKISDMLTAANVVFTAFMTKMGLFGAAYEGTGTAVVQTNTLMSASFGLLAAAMAGVMLGLEVVNSEMSKGSSAANALYKNITAQNPVTTVGSKIPGSNTISTNESNWSQLQKQQSALSAAADKQAKIANASTASKALGFVTAGAAGTGVTETLNAKGANKTDLKNLAATQATMQTFIKNVQTIGSQTGQSTAAIEKMADAMGIDLTTATDTQVAAVVSSAQAQGNWNTAINGSALGARDLATALGNLANKYASLVQHVVDLSSAQVGGAQATQQALDAQNQLNAAAITYAYAQVPVEQAEVQLTGAYLSQKQAVLQLWMAKQDLITGQYNELQLSINMTNAELNLASAYLQTRQSQLGVVQAQAQLDRDRMYGASSLKLQQDELAVQQAQLGTKQTQVGLLQSTHDLANLRAQYAAGIPQQQAELAVDQAQQQLNSSTIQVTSSTEQLKQAQNTAANAANTYNEAVTNLQSAVNALYAAEAAIITQEGTTGPQATNAAIAALQAYLKTLQPGSALYNAVAGEIALMKTQEDQYNKNAGALNALAASTNTYAGAVTTATGELNKFAGVHTTAQGTINPGGGASKTPATTGYKATPSASGFGPSSATPGGMGGNGPVYPSFDVGGFNTVAGLAMLHASELVLPMNDMPRTLQLLQQVGFLPGANGANMLAVAGPIPQMMSNVPPASQGSTQQTISITNVNGPVQAHDYNDFLKQMSQRSKTNGATSTGSTKTQGVSQYGGS